MSKKQIFALVLIALSVVIVVLNRGTLSVNLVITTLSGLKSMVLLGFIAVGVIIGILLHK